MSQSMWTAVADTGYLFHGTPVPEISRITHGNAGLHLVAVRLHRFAVS